MAMPTHQIWGSIELDGSSECNGSSSFARSGSEPSQGRDQRRRCNLPEDLQQHLRQVIFRDESKSSDLSASYSMPPAEREKLWRRQFAAQEAFRVAALAAAEEFARADSELQVAPPAVQAAELPSKGSASHAEGNCKPCSYVHTKLGCLNGQDCGFCHIPHSTKSRTRPCKAKRMQSKRLQGMIDNAAAKDPEQFAEAAKGLANNNEYLRSVLQKDSHEPVTTSEQGVSHMASGAFEAFMNLLKGSPASDAGHACSEDLASI
jgi:hypothetical protein